MILIIDNYDSFTWNLVDYVRRVRDEVVVRRNDAISLEEIRDLNPKGILLSPGPGRPEDSGICLDLVAEFKSSHPIFGVCMGLQVIGQQAGAHLIHADRPMHGKTSVIQHDNEGVFQGIPNPIQVMRYHSLVLEKKSLPKIFKISSQTESGEIMGIRHRDLPLEGVQFHPESILSEAGDRLVSNWVNSLF